MNNDELAITYRINKKRMIEGLKPITNTTYETVLFTELNDNRKNRGLKQIVLPDDSFESGSFSDSDDDVSLHHHSLMKHLPQGYVD